MRERTRDERRGSISDALLRVPNLDCGSLISALEWPVNFCLISCETLAFAIADLMLCLREWNDRLNNARPPAQWSRIFPEIPAFDMIAAKCPHNPYLRRFLSLGLRQNAPPNLFAVEHGGTNQCTSAGSSNPSVR